MSKTRQCNCQVCGEFKTCERIYDTLFSRHFWMCATCVLGLMRTGGLSDAPQRSGKK